MNIIIMFAKKVYFKRRELSLYSIQLLTLKFFLIDQMWYGYDSFSLYLESLGQFWRGVKESYCVTLPFGFPVRILHHLVHLAATEAYRLEQGSYPRWATLIAVVTSIRQSFPVVPMVSSYSFALN